MDIKFTIVMDFNGDREVQERQLLNELVEVARR